MDPHYRDLLSQNEEYLFLNGGCHVFASALHDRFRYQLVCVRHSSSGSVPHVYCRCEGYMVDVMGFTHEREVLDARFWNVPPFSAVLVTPAEIARYYVRSFPCPGLYADEQFLTQARLRAEKRIVDYLRFYDGAFSQSIRPHPFLERTSEADINAIFS